MDSTSPVPLHSIMVRASALRARGHGFNPWQCHTKDYRHPSLVLSIMRLALGNACLVGDYIQPNLIKAFDPYRGGGGPNCS